MFSSIQCPYCGRKFCEQAAEKHIKYCREKSKLMQNSNKKAHTENNKKAVLEKGVKSARVPDPCKVPLIKTPSYNEFIELEKSYGLKYPGYSPN